MCRAGCWDWHQCADLPLHPTLPGLANSHRLLEASDTGRKCEILYEIFISGLDFGGVPGSRFPHSALAAGCWLSCATFAGVWLKPRWVLTMFVSSAPWAQRELFSPFLLRRVIEVCYGEGGNPGTGTRVHVCVCVCV